MASASQITKVVEFDAGHRIPSHKSKCRHLHGHRYRLEVTLEGDIKPVRGESDDGMVLDFGDVKAIALAEIHDKWDHATLVWEGDRALLAALEKLPGNATVVLPVVPTAENLASLIFEILDRAYSSKYGSTLRLSRVRLYETPTSWADQVRAQ